MDKTVLLGHGSGGRMMKRLVDEVFLEAFGNPALDAGDDAGVVAAPSGRLALSTDSFVVTPAFFPGGDIGRLAVAGTVNDIATSGARPLYLTCGFILEEGFPMDDLRRICASMAATAAKYNIQAHQDSHGDCNILIGNIFSPPPGLPEAVMAESLKMYFPGGRPLYETWR